MKEKKEKSDLEEAVEVYEKTKPSWIGHGSAVYSEAQMEVNRELLKSFQTLSAKVEKLQNLYCPHGYRPMGLMSRQQAREIIEAVNSRDGE